MLIRCTKKLLVELKVEPDSVARRRKPTFLLACKYNHGKS